MASANGDKDQHVMTASTALAEAIVGAFPLVPTETPDAVTSPHETVKSPGTRLRRPAGYVSNPDATQMCLWAGCDDGETTFDSADELTRHLSAIHVGRNQASYICEWSECKRGGKPFLGRTKIMTHLRVHTNQLPHVCHLCLTSFSTEILLATHAKEHMDVKPFPCPVPTCKKAFYHPRSLRKHTNHHPPEEHAVIHEAARQGMRLVRDQQSSQGDSVTPFVAAMSTVHGSFADSQYSTGNSPTFVSPMGSPRSKRSRGRVSPVDDTDFDFGRTSVAGSFCSSSGSAPGTFTREQAVQLGSPPPAKRKVVRPPIAGPTLPSNSVLNGNASLPILARQVPHLRSCFREYNAPHNPLLSMATATLATSSATNSRTPLPCSPAASLDGITILPPIAPPPNVDTTRQRMATSIHSPSTPCVATDVASPQSLSSSSHDQHHVSEVDPVDDDSFSRLVLQLDLRNTMQLHSAPSTPTASRRRPFV